MPFQTQSKSKEDTGAGNPQYCPSGRPPCTHMEVNYLQTQGHSRGSSIQKLHVFSQHIHKETARSREALQKVLAKEKGRAKSWPPWYLSMISEHGQAFFHPLIGWKAQLNEPHSKDDWPYCRLISETQACQTICAGWGRSEWSEHNKMVRIMHFSPLACKARYCE